MAVSIYPSPGFPLVAATRSAFKARARTSRIFLAEQSFPFAAEDTVGLFHVLPVLRRPVLGVLGSVGILTPHPLPALGNLLLRLPRPSHASHLAK